MQEQPCLHENSNVGISQDCREFIEALDEPTVMVEAETRRIAALNSPAASLFGMTREDIVGQECHCFICPSEKGKCPICDLGMMVDHSRRDILVKGKDRVTVIKSVRSIKLGGRDYLLETIEPLSKNADSQLARVQHVELFRNLFYENHAVMLIIDSESGKILEANNAAAAFYGYRIHEMKKKNIRDFSSMPGQQVFEAIAGSTGEIEGQGTFIHRLANGELRQVEMQTGTIQWEGKQALYSIIHDVTEKMNSEKALNERTAELDQLFGNAPFGVFLLDEKRRIRRANRQAEIMFGYLFEEMEGELPEELIVPECEIEQAKKNGDVIYIDRQVLRFQSERKRKDGSTLQIRFIGFPVMLAGNMVGAYIVYQDVTEESQARTNLRASERRYRSLVEDMPLMVSRYDANFVLNFVNGEYCRYFQKDESELLGRSFFEILPEEQRETVRAYFASLTEDAPVGSITHSTVLPDGSLTWQRWIDRAIFNESGRKIGFQSIGLDITEQYEKQRKITFLSSIMDHSLNEIYVIDPKTLRYEYANQGAIEALGYSREELLSMTPLDLKPLFTPETFQKMIAPLLEGEVPLVSTQTLHRRKNGTEYDLAITFQTIGEGEDLRLVGMGLDVSEKARMQRELEENEKRYRSLFRENSAPMWLVDPKSGRFFEVNKAAIETYGYTEEQFKTMSIFDINRMSSEDLLARMQEVVDGEANRFGFEHYLASGEKRFVEVLTTGVTLNGKNLIHSIMHDVTEKVKVQKALLEKTAELDQLFENAPFAVFLSDEKRRIVRGNRQATVMFGYEAEEMIGKTTEDLFVPDEDKEQGWRYSDTVFLEQKVERFEAMRRRKDGSLLPVSCIGFPLMLAGDTIGAYIIYQDMTEKRKAQESLEKSERKFRSLFEESSAVMLLFSPDSGAIVGANRAAEKFYGYSREKFLTLNHSDINVMDPERLLQERRRSVQGVKRRFNSKHRLANGKIRDVEAFAGVVDLMEGSVILSIVQDVSARTRAENLLHREKAYLDSLFEMAPDAVVVTDDRGAVVRANKSFYELFGYEKEDCIGKNLDRLVSGNNRAIEREANEITEKINLGNTIKTETVRSRNNGDIFPCRVVTLPLSFEDGTKAGYILYHDLSEERQREGQLAITNEIVKNSPVVLFRWPNEIGGEKVLYVSENIRQWGYEPEEIISESFSYYADLVHPDDWSRVKAVTRKHIEAGTDRFEVEYRIRKANGDWIWVSDRTRIPRDGSSNVQYQEGIVIDITERKRVEGLTTEVNESLRKHVAEMDKAFGQTIEVLAATAEAKDPYTAGHQRKVAQLAVRIAEELGMKNEEAKVVELAALVHDIGKIEIPSEILVKPGRLSPIEMQLIRTHPEAGHKILETIELPWPLAEIVLQHHERMDGSGYPRGVKGKDILREARIISVADTLEAMSSHRPYRPALGLEAAFQELKERRGTSYDEVVVDACLEVFAKGFGWEDEEE